MSLTLEKLQEDLKVLTQRKEDAINGFNQIIGAISILEQMIHRLKTADEEVKPEHEEEKEAA